MVQFSKTASIVHFNETKTDREFIFQKYIILFESNYAT